MVVVVRDGPVATLYLNAKVVCVTDVRNGGPVCEQGDIVLVELKPGNSKFISLSGDGRVTMPAEVITMQGDSVTLVLLAVNERITVPMNQILFRPVGVL